jgi:GT2 family glycosyltransferase
VLYPLNMALYRSALAEVGGFDERLGPGTPFPASEDGDLGFRLLEAGYAIHYAPQAALVHRAWRTQRDYLPLRWGYGLGRGAFYAKHLSWRDRQMRRRAWRDLARLRHWPGLLLRDRRAAQGDIVLVGGIVWGALRWAATYGWAGSPAAGPVARRARRV